MTKICLYVTKLSLQTIKLDLAITNILFYAHFVNFLD